MSSTDGANRAAGMGTGVRRHRLWIRHVGRALGAARRSPRTACLLAALSGLAALSTVAFRGLSWQYPVPALVLASLAATLGGAAFLGRRPLLSFGLDDIDRSCLTTFRRQYGEVAFAPVVVVIAAYQEAASIGAVLDELPAVYRSVRVDTLVIVDGATDATGVIAAAHGARVCVVPVNRGQGAAFRLGYALARAGGARFIVTTDADGQYVGAELPRLLDPLVADDADFVTGSRWLGDQETTDPIRRLGSHVFARLASHLTHQTITDTSFGFRAMKAEMTESVVLRQPQYQSSELLIAAIAHGYRTTERPLTMQTRSHGRTKKGNFVVYGSRYACVLIGTWLRAHCHPSRGATRSADKAAHHAPAAEAAAPAER